MENNNQEEKKARRSFWKGFFLGTSIVVLAAVEVVRGGKDIKNATTKVKSWFQPKVTDNNQNRQNNQNGNWNNKQQQRKN